MLKSFGMVFLDFGIGPDWLPGSCAISTGLGFSKNQCECPVHILRSPWVDLECHSPVFFFVTEEYHEITGRGRFMGSYFGLYFQ